MIPPDLRTTRRWRLGLAAVVAFDLVRTSVSTAAAYASGALDAVDATAYTLGTSTAFLVVGPLVGSLGLLHFARAPGRWAGAVVALMAMTCAFHVHAFAHGEPNESLGHGAATLLGWVLGLGAAVAVGLGRDLPPTARAVAREGLAATTGLAFFAGTYVAAGLVKLDHSGVAWADPIRLRMLALHFLHDVPADGALHAWRAWLVDSPTAARLLALATLAIEVGAVALPLGRRARVLGCASLVGMHVGIWATTGIVFVSANLLLLLWLVTSLREPHLVATEDFASPALRWRPRPARLVAVVAGAVGLAALTWAVPPQRSLPLGVHPEHARVLEAVHGRSLDLPEQARLGDSGLGLLSGARACEALGPLVPGEPFPALEGWRVRAIGADPQGQGAHLVVEAVDGAGQPIRAEPVRRRDASVGPTPIAVRLELYALSHRMAGRGGRVGDLAVAYTALHGYDRVEAPTEAIMAWLVGLAGAGGDHPPSSEGSYPGAGKATWALLSGWLSEARCSAPGRDLVPPPPGAPSN